VDDGCIDVNAVADMEMNFFRIINDFNIAFDDKKNFFAFMLMLVTTGNIARRALVDGSFLGIAS
jgi:hypothetical protein